MKRILGIAVMVTALLCATNVWALWIIDFGIVAPTSGSISYAGGNAPLIGSMIDVDNVVGLSTPVNQGVAIQLPGAVLNFMTGNLTGFTATTWDFGGGPASTITITIGNQVLLQGKFGTATVTTFGGLFKIAGGSFWDYKDEILLDFYGLGAYVDDIWSGNFNISFNAIAVPNNYPPNAFTSIDVLSGDVVNTIPEPGTMLLLGTGLVGLGAIRRRRSKKNS